MTTPREVRPPPRLPRDVEDALACLAALVEVGSASASAARGQRDEHPSDGEMAWCVDGATRGTGAPTLTEALYLHWYTHPPERSPRVADVYPLTRSSLASALRAAHAGASVLLAEWVVTDANPRGVITVARGTDTRLLRPGEYLAVLRAGVPPAAGETVRPVARADRLDQEREMWWTFSAEPVRTPLGRVYLNARPDSAPRTLHIVTELLRTRSIPYALKCPVQANAHERADSMVVYHAKSDRRRLLGYLRSSKLGLSQLLDPAVPPLTRAIRPGLSWADDPGTDMSFGQSRCEALARAILDACPAWATESRAGRIRILTSGLRRARISPFAPWLERA